MKNKIALWAVYVFTFLAIGSSIFYCFNSNKIIGEISFVLEEITLFIAIVMVVLNGRFITTIIGIIFTALLITISIGNAINIRHWLNGNLTIFLTFIGLFVVYSKWFFMKKNKTRLDLLKYVWMLTFFVSNYFYHQLHLISRIEYHFILDAVFLIVFIEFIRSGIKAKTLFEG